MKKSPQGNSEKYLDQEDLVTTTQNMTLWFMMFQEFPERFIRR